MIYSVLLRCWIAAQDPTRPRLPATADRSALHGRRPFFSSRHPAKHSAAILNLTTSPAVEGQTELYFNGRIGRAVDRAPSIGPNSGDGAKLG